MTKKHLNTTTGSLSSGNPPEQETSIHIHNPVQPAQRRRRVTRGQDPVDQTLLKAWQQTVHARCDYRCVLTGTTNQGVEESCLHAHHLYSWSGYPSQRYDPLNGVILLNSVHKAFHATYDPSTNLVDFEEFVADNYAHIDNAWNRGLKNGPFSSHGDTSVLDHAVSQEKRRVELKYDKMVDKAKKLNHEIISGTYERNTSVFYIACRNRACTRPRMYYIMARCYLYNTHGLYCCWARANARHAVEARRDAAGRFVGGDVD